MTTLLDSKIKEKGVKKSVIAYKLGISPQTLSAKLHGKSEFTVDEALDISKILDIRLKDFEKFFCSEN